MELKVKDAKGPLCGRHRLIVALAAVVVWLALAAPSPAQDYVASLSKAQGQVDVQRNLQPIPGATGLRLASGDKVVTRLGRATILFDDGSEIRLQKQTEIDIKQPKGEFTRSLKVFAGRLWARMRSNKSLTTEFQSGTVITAIRGTILEYFYDPLTGVLKVGCTEGSITVKFMEGGEEKTITIDAGQMLELTMGAPPEKKMFQEGDIYGIVIEGDVEEFQIKQKTQEDTGQDSGNRGGEASSPNPND